MFKNIITDKFKNYHTEAITEVIRGLGTDCETVVGGTKFINCPNCIFDPSTGKSTNKYKVGGPTPFDFGRCPHCAGQGKILVEQKESVHLLVVYNYKDWIQSINTNVDSPEGYVQTLSLFDTYEQLLQAKEIIINTEILTSIVSKFERHGEPQPCGLGNADFIATMWKRIENG